MIIEMTKMKLLSYILVMMYVFSSLGPYLPETTWLTIGASLAEASGLQEIGDLEIGDRVVDNSWVWEFRTGYNYIAFPGDVTKPIVWIVVAKNHYIEEDIGVAQGEHVTLMSEEVIGLYPFDNSTDRGSSWGNNHWGDSGLGNASLGIRPWLNSFGAHKSEGFYNSMSSEFKDNIIDTKLSNKTSDGFLYATYDKVFIPSSTELNGGSNFSFYIGKEWEFFSSFDEDKRITKVNKYDTYYWTRSPSNNDTNFNVYVNPDGWLGSHYFPSYTDSCGVRPVVNIKSDTMVTNDMDENGVYLLDREINKIKFGHVLGNDYVSVSDAIAVLRHIVGLHPLSKVAIERAIVTSGNNEVSVQDAIAILRYVVGLINSLPVNENVKPGQVFIQMKHEQIYNGEEGYLGLARGRINNFGGVSPQIGFVNRASETIKYIYFEMIPFNAVGDIVKCTINGHSSFIGKFTGPIYPGYRTGGVFSSAWYNNTVDRVELKELTIEYMNGTIKVIAGKNIDYSD